MKSLRSSLILLLLGCATAATAQQIPSTLFGLHDDWLYVTPAISFGTARFWDVNNSAGNNFTRWDTLANCVPNSTTCTATNNNWHWSDFDQALADIYQQCPSCDVTYTFGGIAGYANHCAYGNDDSGCPSGDPTGVGCGNTRNGGCYLPPDIQSDGSGTNESMITFWSFFATHLAQLQLKSGYARITSFSLGNEYYRNPCIDPGYNQSYCTNGNPNGNYTFVATYAQLQRMFADMKATVSGILTAANIMFLNGSTGQQTVLIQNMMYCDGTTTSSPCGCPNNGKGSGYACKCSGSSGGCGNSGTTTCSGGVGNKCGLSGFVDAMDFHDYLSDSTGQGEEIVDGISDVRDALAGTDQDLPVWITETSFSSDNTLQDWDMEAGFAARLMISCWSGGASRCYWYRFNTWGCHDLHRSDWATGTMYDNTEDQNGNPMTNMDQCQTGKAPGLWWDGVAYNRVYGWLVGTTMTTMCSANSGTVGLWTCDLTDGSGNPEQIVWWNDASHQETWCSGSTPITHGSCTSIEYHYPSNYAYYQTLDPSQGTRGLTSPTVPVSGQPILLLQTPNP